MDVSILSTLLNWHCQYNIHSIHDCLLMGDARPYHMHARAVQQWRHRLTACVKASGENLERS